ncbi:MAG: hypothetical protein KF730_11015 [Sphingomonas sp.]|uniref:hypothetical protein n=1 Tax=Sphingomonas sp. TaxID=28214 RepID=UPI0025F06E8A|nr:hypothetical protein [Sphingomonas sp.]MBX3565090.1 hypothetical protein [Sphingomonas sp.]
MRGRMVTGIGYSLAATPLLFVGAAVAQEAFGNHSIIALARAGVGNEVMLAKIDSLPCAYDVSTAAIVALKEAGISDRVIAAMVSRCTGAASAQGAVAATSSPAIRRTPGLYLDLGNDAAHRLALLRPINASGGRATGNGSLLFPYRLKLAIPRASAQTAAASHLPSFYFYFETDDPKVGDFGTASTVTAQSPSEFNLVRFEERGGQREMVVGKRKVFGATVGIDPKDALQFSIKEIGDGIFAVTPLAPLPPGQYGFVLRAEKDIYRVYDFFVSD